MVIALRRRSCLAPSASSLTSTASSQESCGQRWSLGSRYHGSVANCGICRCVIILRGLTDYGRLALQPILEPSAPIPFHEATLDLAEMAVEPNFSFRLPPPPHLAKKAHLPQPNRLDHVGSAFPPAGAGDLTVPGSKTRPEGPVNQPAGKSALRSASLWRPTRLFALIVDNITRLTLGLAIFDQF